MQGDKHDDLWLMLFYLTDHLRDQISSSPDLEYLDNFKDLTHRQLKTVRHVMYMVEQHPEGITLKMLAKRGNLSAAAASEMVDALVKKGIFVRTQSITDRRSIQIRITDKMTQELGKISKFLAQQTRQMTKDINPDELKVMVSVIEQLYNKTKAEDKQSCE